MPSVIIVNEQDRLTEGGVSGKGPSYYAYRRLLDPYLEKQGVRPGEAIDYDLTEVDDADELAPSVLSGKAISAPPLNVNFGVYLVEERKDKVRVYGFRALTEGGPLLIGTIENNFNSIAFNPIEVDHTKGKDFSPDMPSARSLVYYQAWIENYESQYVGGLASSAFVESKISTSSADHLITDSSVYETTQYTNVVGNGVGLVGGNAFSLVFPYKKVRSNNPWYRVYDALAAFGAALGDFLSFFTLPFVPQGAQTLISLFLGGILSFTFGLLAFPYCYGKEKYEKRKEKNKKDQYGIFLMSEQNWPGETSDPTHLRIYEENGQLFYYVQGTKYYITQLPKKMADLLIELFQGPYFLTTKEKKKVKKFLFFDADEIQKKEKNLLYLTLTQAQRRAYLAVLDEVIAAGHLKKMPADTEIDLFSTHVQGWAYYTKTGQMFGSNLGGMIGAGSGVPRTSYQYASFGALSGFFLSLVGVPIINAMTNGRLGDRYDFEIISAEKYFYLQETFKANTYLILFIAPGLWELVYVDRQSNHQILPIKKVKYLAEALNEYQGEVDQIYEEEMAITSKKKVEIDEAVTALKIKKEQEFQLEFPDQDEIIKTLQAEHAPLAEPGGDPIKRRAAYVQDKQPLLPLIDYFHYTHAIDTFRHNYTRTGMILGIFVGQIIGYLASFFVPGVNVLIDMLVCAGGFGIAGGIYFGFKGGQISKREHGDKYTDNSWDYNTREGVELGGYIGGLVGFCLVPVLGPLGPFVGMAVGSVVGWGVGFYVSRVARAVVPNEDESKTLTSWTIRVALQAKIGGVIGALIGLGVGLLGGPFGAVTGVVAGYYIGSIVGYSYGMLSGEHSRHALWKTICAIGQKIGDACHRLYVSLRALFSHQPKAPSSPPREDGADTQESSLRSVAKSLSASTSQATPEGGLIVISETKISPAHDGSNNSPPTSPSVKSVYSPTSPTFFSSVGASGDTEDDLAKSKQYDIYDSLCILK